MGSASQKAKAVDVLGRGGRGALGKYRQVVYGDLPLGRCLWAEFVFTLLGGMPGAAGLALRALAYRPLFAEIGRRVVFGRNMTVRHPGKIRLGSDILFDDNTVLDAKGRGNEGLSVGGEVFVGRNSMLVCKGGAIRLEGRNSISVNCEILSSNEITIGRDTVIGAYAYLLSGGVYDYRRADATFFEQTGDLTRGPLRIGRNCWLGTRVTVLDGASVGDHCVIGAGAVVTRPVPPDSVAVGVPARVIRRMGEPASPS